MHSTDLEIHRIRGSASLLRRTAFVRDRLRLSRLRHAAWLLVSLAHLGAASAHAQLVELAPATSTVVRFCELGNVGDIIEGPVDDFCVINTNETRSNSRVVTSFGPVISASTLTDCDCRFNLSLGIQTSARVDFELRVREISTPGQQISSIPVRFSASATVDTSAVGIAAVAQVSARSSSSVPPSSPDLFDAKATTLEGSTFDFRQFDSVDLQETVNLVIDNINLVRVATSCQIRFDFDDDITAGCNVSESSGSFAFDQQAFDLAQGENTFALADFYAIDLSPGLVPEPSLSASTVAALATLFALRRLKTNAPVRFARRPSRHRSAPERDSSIC